MPSPTAAYRYLALKYAPPALVSIILYLHSSKEYCSAKKLAATSGVHEDTVKLYLRALLLAKQIYIADWQRKSLTGPPIPLYAIGSKLNAARPEKKSYSERCKDWRSKKKQQQQTAWPNLF